MIPALLAACACSEPPGDADAALPDVLGNDALADAPEVAGKAPTPAAGVPPEEALPVVVPEDLRTQLERLLKGTRVDAIFRASREFNSTVGDGRSIDPLTLGLLWLSEGAARLTIAMDPSDPNFGLTHAGQLSMLVALRASPPDTRRAWRIAVIGVWGSGLDDLFSLDPGDTLPQLDFATSEARWVRRLSDRADWTHGVSFASVVGTMNPPLLTALGPVDLSYSTGEAVQFLVATAARFTKELWLLPDQLAQRGITLSTDRVEQIPLVEPILAYMCYLQKAPKAAGLYEALLFLRDLSSAVSFVAQAPFDQRLGYDLSPVIDALNRWLGPLRDSSLYGLPAILRTLVVDATALAPGGRLGRDVLADIAARSAWDPIPPQVQLDPDGKALLEELVDAWLGFARAADALPGPITPGELFFKGADPNVSPPLFPRALGTTGFGARNYGQRFQRATRLPLGAEARRVVTPIPAAPRRDGRTSKLHSPRRARRGTTRTAGWIGLPQVEASAPPTCTAVRTVGRSPGVAG